MDDEPPRTLAAPAADPQATPFGPPPRPSSHRRLRAARCADSAPEPQLLRLAIAAERRERWARAAALSNSELESWMVATLDEAANGLLTLGASGEDGAVARDDVVVS